MNAALEIAFVTDVGKIRELNEDSGWAEDVPLNSENAWGASGVLLVADGMGGHQAGEVASGLAAEFARRVFVEGEFGEEIEIDDETLENAVVSAESETIFDQQFSENFQSDVRAAVRQINRAVYNEAGRAAGQSDSHPGTTFTMALLREREYLIAHIGDSRAYLIGADFSVRQISEDHSFVGESIRSGAMTQAEARVSPLRNQITRAMGLEADVEADIHAGAWQKHDVLLLCSDGLCEHVSDEEIGEIVGLERTLSRACQALVDLANERGGSDNISVAAARHKNAARAGSTPGASATGASTPEAVQKDPTTNSLQSDDGDDDGPPYTFVEPPFGIANQGDTRAQIRRARRRKNNFAWIAGLLFVFGVLLLTAVLSARKRAASQRAIAQSIAPASRRAAPAPIVPTPAVPVEIRAALGGKFTLAATNLKYKITGKADSGTDPDQVVGQLSFTIADSDLDGATLELCAGENCGEQAVADSDASREAMALKLSPDQIYALCLRYEKTGKLRRVALFQVKVKTQTAAASPTPSSQPQ